MCAQRDSSTITRWEVLSVSQSSSSSNTPAPSDLERVDLALMRPSSKRKAALPPEEAARPQKSALTDTSHRPGMTGTETEVSPHSQRLFDSPRAGVVSLSAMKKMRKKVSLRRNHELLHSLLKSGSGSGNLGRDNAPSKPRRLLKHSVPELVAT
ncbi:hypothetical protein BJV78DRAFT_445830 [Lactifluus subvellereus]|nr:hypothetical protein BJV78DRAFT_445830 [Lactifluus subvellereus]